MQKRSRMPGLRLKGKIWHIEKRCEYAEGGWLRESTETSSRPEAEKIMIRRLAEIEKNAQRKEEGVYLFEEAALRYLEEISEKPSATVVAMHLDRLFPFIGNLPLEQLHDGTLRNFIDSELSRGCSAKTINNEIAVVSAVLNRSARVWRREDGKPWLRQAPAKLTRQSLKGRQAKPYPLSWEEQDKLCALLPGYRVEAVLYALNTGCRDQEVCSLQWDWEVYVKDLGASVFVLPESITKTKTERVVPLNSIARSVIESRRGIHHKYVFTCKGKPFSRLHTSSWKRAWKKAGLPDEDGILKGVHNLRHTFGRRLRGAGVPLETRKALLGHTSGDITTHYSAAELKELIDAVEMITDRGVAQTPTLTVVKRSQDGTVGNLSEIKKGLLAKKPQAL